MEGKKAFSLLFFLILSFSATCSSLSSEQERIDFSSPQHDRSIMKQVKSQRRRLRRQASASVPFSSDLDVALANATGPQLIKDIFKNLTHDDYFPGTVIRSLQHIPKGNEDFYA